MALGDPQDAQGLRRALSNSDRIHIIGGPGAGKTTLASRLVRRRGVAHHKLDDIAFDPDSGVARPLAVRLHDISSIADQPAWVTEGVYLWWTSQLLTLADLIVWLDLPPYAALFRKLPHHLQRTLTGGYPHAGMRNQIAHTLFAWNYYMKPGGAMPYSSDEDRRVTRSATSQVLEPFARKVVRCRTTADVNSLLEDSV